jgi:hypothetical protein
MAGVHRGTGKCGSAANSSASPAEAVSESLVSTSLNSVASGRAARRWQFVPELEWDRFETSGRIHHGGRTENPQSFSFVWRATDVVDISASKVTSNDEKRLLCAL